MTSKLDLLSCWLLKKSKTDKQTNGEKTHNEKGVLREFHWAWTLPQATSLLPHSNTQPS